MGRERKMVRGKSGGKGEKDSEREEGWEGRERW